jgi:hypothetical protein
VGFNQSREHRPVSRALGLFRFDEIRQGQQICLVFVEGDGGPSLPEFRKRIDAAHHRHDIDSQAFNARSLTAEMNRQTSMKEGLLERGDGDHFGLKFVKCRLKTPQILRFGEDREIHVTAKFRSAVKHARLAAHQ